MLPRITLGIFFACLAATALCDPVDDLVKKEMVRQHIPGLTVGVLLNGKVVKMKGYGFANMEWSDSAKADTIYEIGSITKQFTAEAIMMLVEQGKVALDEKISKYIQGTPETWKDITVRNLLNQVSGLKNYTSLLGFVEKMRENTSHEAFLKLLGSQPLDFPPDTKWEYSNTNYYLLGMIVEAVAGESYGDFLQSRIFKALGMQTASLNDPTRVVANRAAGYSWSGKEWQNAPYVSMSWPYAAGALMMSAEDYAKWIVALDQQKLLSPQSYEAIYTPAKLASGAAQKYGFGWVLDSYHGHSMIFHNGGIPGFVTEAIRWPQDKLTVIVFTNSDTCDPDKIARRVSGLYVSSLKPPSMLPPATDPNPVLTKSMLELIDHFAKGDPNMPEATEDLKKQLNEHTIQIAKDLMDHLKSESNS